MGYVLEIPGYIHDFELLDVPVFLHNLKEFYDGLRPGPNEHLYSLHAVQKTYLIVSDASGAYIIGTNLSFPRNTNGSCLRATRLPAGTTEVKKSQSNVRAKNFQGSCDIPLRLYRKDPPRRKYVLDDWRF